MKVCCVQSVEEAALAVRHGAAAVGLVSAMPSGPGVIAEDRIAEIARTVPPGVTSFLLTSAIDPDAVVAQHRRTGTGAIQLCDRLTADARRALRAALPGIRLVQVVHVRGQEALAEGREAAIGADALLLDSGAPDDRLRTLGGTGRAHDWEISRRIVGAVDVPVFLAGGLRPDNVGEAIGRVRPFGVDVCTGLRTGDRLDAGKLARFVAEVAMAGPSRRPV